MTNDGSHRRTPAADWNHRGDLGERWDDLVAELAAAHPEHAEWIHAYHQRWDEMLAVRSTARLGQRFDLRPATTLFIDDRAGNIAGAAARGWHTHHFTDAAALAPALARVGLPAPSLQHGA